MEEDGCDGGSGDGHASGQGLTSGDSGLGCSTGGGSCALAASRAAAPGSAATASRAAAPGSALPDKSVTSNDALKNLPHVPALDGPSWLATHAAIRRDKKAAMNVNERPTATDFHMRWHNFLSLRPCTSPRSWPV